MGGRFTMFEPVRRMMLTLRGMVVVAAALVAAPSAMGAGDAASESARFTLDDVGRLVAQLGDDKYDIRENASQQLTRAGIAAKPMLIAALENSDAEVRARSRKILDDVRKDALPKQLAEFRADVNGTKNTTLPGWTDFQRAIGDSKAARQLFIEMQQAEGSLFEAYEWGSKEAARALAERTPFAMDQPRVVGRRAQTEVMPASLGSTLALLFVAGNPNVPLGDDLLGLLMKLPDNREFINTTAFNSTAERSQLCRKIIARWIGRQVSERFIPNQIRLAAQYELKEGLQPAIAFLKLGQETPTTDAKVIGNALLLLSVFGDKEQLEIVEPYLQNSRIAYSATDPRPMQAQVRDLALVAIVKLSSQDPKPYGLDSFLRSTRGALERFPFQTDEERTAAFKRWESCQKEQKQAAREQSQTKPG
jgi:hypothetical protein